MRHLHEIILIYTEIHSNREIFIKIHGLKRTKRAANELKIPFMARLVGKEGRVVHIYDKSCFSYNEFSKDCTKKCSRSGKATTFHTEFVLFRLGNDLQENNDFNDLGTVKIVFKRPLFDLLKNQMNRSYYFAAFYKLIIANLAIKDKRPTP